MPTIYLMCGIPASGKSTIAKEIAAAESAVILSSDDIRRELFKGKKFNHNQLEETFRVLRQRLTMAFKSGLNIVLDSSHKWASERRGHVISAKRRGYRTVCVFCRKNYVHAIYANQNREDHSRKVPEKAIRNAYRQFCVPVETEGWDEIRVIDGNEYSIKKEGQKRLKAWQYTEKKG